MPSSPQGAFGAGRDAEPRRQAAPSYSPTTIETFMSFHLSELLDTAERNALKTGDREEAETSRLAEADKATHGVIVAGLNTLSESIPALSEEDTGSFAGPMQTAATDGWTH